MNTEQIKYECNNIVNDVVSDENLFQQDVQV